MREIRHGRGNALFSHSDVSVESLHGRGPRAHLEVLKREMEKRANGGWSVPESTQTAGTAPGDFPERGCTGGEPGYKPHRATGETRICVLRRVPTSELSNLEGRPGWWGSHRVRLRPSLRVERVGEKMARSLI